MPSGASPRMASLLAAAERVARIGSWQLDLASGRGLWSDEMFRLHGLEPGAAEPSVELLIERVHPDDRGRMRARLEAMLRDPEHAESEGVQSEYRVLLPDGCMYELRFDARLERDGEGAPGRWICSAQDVTEQRRAERALQAHYAVSRALRDWETFDEGVTVLLRRLGTALDLPMGSLWTCDREEGRLRCRAFWHAPDVNTGEFEPLTRDATFAVGQGVPGAVWQSGRPEIVPDAHEQFDFKRRQAAAALGLRSGLAIPAVADGHTLAVLSYYSFDRHPPSDLVMRTLTGIGAEIGRFLSRRRANLQPSALSPRELEVLGLAAAGNSGPEIAVLLMLSPGTVKTHFANIYEKLGVGDRAAAVAHALRTGLID